MGHCRCVHCWSYATKVPGPVLTSQVMHGYDYGVDEYPIPRMGTPEDMAAAVVFLASPASAYVTGEVIKVTGGMGM